MGHFLFIILHLIAVFLGMVLLFVTIPAHLIYAAIANRRADRPTAKTHLTCPDCKELILKQAHVCKHCGCKLIPQS